MIWTGFPRATGKEWKSATTDTVERKEFSAFEIKDDATGQIEAIICTFDVVDKDGDIVKAGAIPDGSTVAISGYGHSAMYGEAPVGKGTIAIQGNKAIVKGELFMDLAAARDCLTVLKGMGKDQQWSWGFAVTGVEMPDDAQRKQGVRRVITKTDTFETSPVIRGAGVGTRTTVAKEATLTAEEKEEKAQAERDAAAAVAEAARVTADTERKAREEADVRAAAELTVLNAIASEEFARFQRTQRRLGAA